MSSPATITRDDDAVCVSWPNGCAIKFACDPAGDLQGIRDVTVNGIALRCPAKLWRPRFSTPQGVVYTRFTLVDAAPTSRGQVDVVCTAHGYRSGICEEQDEYLGDMVELSADDSPIEDEFTWCLRPAEQELDGRRFVGFSVQYRFRASDPARQLWRIFDDATWEIGGALAGNTLFLQGQLNPPVTKLTPDTFFTTACNYYGSEMKGLMGPAQRVSFQRLPRMGTLQAFDFIAHDDGVLFGRFDPLVDVMSIVQTVPGEDVVHVLDELRRPLGNELATHPKLILFHATPEPLTDIAHRNLWCRAYDFVHDACRARHGIRPSPVMPRVWIPQIGERYQIGSASGPRERLLYYLADETLAQWAQMGVREVCTHSLWVSDYTVDRLVRKEDSGWHGQLVVSGICSVRVHEIDPLWGGVEALGYFVNRAHELGMKVQVWYATHLSRRAPIFAERPDFMLMARDGLPNGGGFGKQVLITMDLANPDCFDWEFGKLKAVREATGIDGFFHDSYGNMTFLPSNYAGARIGQQEAYGRLMRKLQDLGMDSFTAEGIGPWAVGHFGMGLVADRPGGGRYQNALEWWLGQEDMIYRLNMGIGSPFGDDPEAAAQFAFRCLAGGGRFGFTEHRNGLEHWDGWLRDLNRVHARIAPLNGIRSLLPEGRGALWQTKPGERLLFTFEAQAVPVAAGEQVHRVGPEQDEPVNSQTEGGNAAFDADPWTIYRIVARR